MNFLEPFEILDHLDKLNIVKELPGEYHCTCPVCGDGAFKIDKKTGKYNAFKCDCAISEIREAIRPIAQAFEEILPPRPIRPPGTKNHTYTTWSLEPRAVVKRIDKGDGSKDFKQGHWTGEKYEPGFPEELRQDLALFRWGEVLQAIEDGAAYIIWTEGEDAANALWDMGIPATTSIGGSKGYDKYGNYAGMITGSRVVVCPDMDIAGIEYAKRIQQDYPDCLWLHAFPNAPQWGDIKKGKGHDIANWIEAGATFEDIIQSIEEKPRIYEPVVLSPSAADLKEKILQYDSEENPYEKELQEQAIKKKFGLTSQSIARLVSFSRSEIVRQANPVQDILANIYGQLERRASGEESAGILTGFNALDAILTGLKPSTLYVLAGRPSVGKCLGKGTKIIMFDGSKKAVEDIQPGDVLMGPDSTPRNVLSVCTGQEQMYWVRQKRGMDYRVNESHILSLKRSRDSARVRRGEILNISVLDYLSELEKSKKFGTNYKGYKAAVDFPESALLVDPYFLGVWLGDGSSSNPCITNPDKEIYEYLLGYAEKLGLQVTTCNPENRCINHSITRGQHQGSDTSSLIRLLKKLGVIGNKHIPQDYLINSRKNRLLLLAGLLDSDGYYIQKTNCFEITQKRRELSEQIIYLCQSLGFYASLNSKKASIKSAGFEGDYFRIVISGNLEEIPTKVSRKQARARTANRDWLSTQITLEKDIVDNYYGFEIDGDRLFLLEDFTVTHNTGAAMAIAANVAQRNRVLVFSLEQSEEQLIYRMVSSVSSINYTKLDTGGLLEHEWAAVSRSLETIGALDIKIDDAGERTVDSISRSIAFQKSLPDLVIIDHLQLIEGVGDDLTSAMTGTSKALKNIAKKYNIPVLVLSQLSRGVEQRSDKRPMMSDLRQSGSIEQDSDVIILMYRDEYYNPNTVDKGIVEFNVAKNRNGPVGMVKLLFEAEFVRFRNYSRI